MTQQVHHRAGTPADPPHEHSRESAVRSALARMDLPAKVRLLTGETNWRTFAVPQVGLRQLVTSDGPAGVRGETWDERSVAVNLPSASALAASWDEDLVERVGELLAAESRRKGVDVLLAPTVNLHRSPLGGRHFECFAEDPLLTGRIGAAYVRGVQRGGVAATVKHYVGNDSETERMTVDVRADGRTLRELYLAPFEQIVAQARPWAVMASYNRVDGVTMTESGLLTDPLATEWGFDGVVVSDWTATRSVEPAANAGLDLAMPGPTGPWGDALLAAVREGRVSEATIDRKVTRLLRLAARVGALAGVEPEVPIPDVADLPGPDAPAARALARQAAAAGMVLVRNDGILPLAAGQLRRVALVGPNAAVARTQGGGSATVYPPLTVSPADGLRELLGDGVELVQRPGSHPRETVPPVDLSLDLALARDPRTGEPGVDLRYLDAGGSLLAREHRLSGRIGWGTPGYEHDAASVELEIELDPAVGGSWRFAVGGLGRHTLDVDGARVLETTIGLAPGEQDGFELFVTPPQRTVDVELAAGRPVRVVLWSVPVVMGGALSVVELGALAPRGSVEDELAAAVAAAASADVAVVVVGTTDTVESEGFDRACLALPGNQDELVRRVAEVNPRTVVVVNSGAPVLMPWRDDVAAVLLGWFGGQELGGALADVLLGRVEPGGRLPTSWPAAQEDCPVLSTTPTGGVLRYDEGLAIGHRAWAAQVAAGGPAPAYWFGHGLGYTSWAFETLDVVGPVPEAAVLAAAGFGVGVVARARVRNIGDRAGATVVQGYLSRPESAVRRPPLWLAGFARASAAPGEAVDVELVLPGRSFAHWTGAGVTDGGWQVEPGAYWLTVAPTADPAILDGATALTATLTIP